MYIFNGTRVDPFCSDAAINFFNSFLCNKSFLLLIGSDVFAACIGVAEKRKDLLGVLYDGFVRHVC